MFLPFETESVAVLVFVILGCKIKIQREQDQTMSQCAEQMKNRGHEETFFFFQPQVFIIAVMFCNCSMWVPDCDLLWSRLKWCYLLECCFFFLFSSLLFINVFKLRHLRANYFQSTLCHFKESHSFSPFGSNYWLAYFGDVEIFSMLCSFL